jgi:hypothetical protein
MPTKSTTEKARRKLAEGKKPSTAAGEFVREEIEHVRQRKHGARSTKQAIAIGLSKARRAGVPLPAPKKGTTSERTRRSAKKALEAGQTKRRARPSAKRSRAAKRALEREGTRAASKKALSRQARTAAARRRTQRARVASSGTKPRRTKRTKAARTT